MKIKFFSILLLLFYSLNMWSQVCSKYTMHNDIDICWGQSVEKLDQEMEKKYQWILWYNKNYIYLNGEKPNQFIINEAKRIYGAQNLKIQQAHTLFLQYRKATCDAVDVENEGAWDAGIMLSQCKYKLTKNYIADLTEQFYPDDWQTVFNKYLHKIEKFEAMHS